MITRINYHTIKLTPDPPAKCECTAKNTHENSLGREIRLAIKSAVQSELPKALWLRRQIRRSDEFREALVQMGCVKGEGELRGWYCPPGPHKIMLKR